MRRPTVAQPTARTIHAFPLVGISREPLGELLWTLDDAFEGTHIFGETGSGKTSGSGATLAKAMLRAGFGGLVLTAKADDVFDWIDPQSGFFRAVTDPRRRVHVFGEQVTADGSYTGAHRPFVIDTSRTFNFLDYEFQRGGQSTTNLVQLLLTALESGGQGNTAHDDAYWFDALRQLLTNAMDLVHLATHKVTLQDMQRVIQSAPQSRHEANSSAWQKSYCWELLEAADENIRKLEQEENSQARAMRHNFKQTIAYWVLDFAGLAERTRSVIVSTFTSKVTGLTRSPIYELLCTGSLGDPGMLDIVERTRAGDVVILNLPVKRYNEVGRFAQVLLKTVWQREIERRADKARPVFLWADEAQFFVTKEDVLFQTTARSSGCATVYLTQNIASYHTMMPGRDPKAATDSLLGNLTTKIFHANGDPSTNEWAQKLFGNERSSVSSSSMTEGKPSTGVTTTVPVPIVQARDFASLRRRGGEVDAILFRTGSHYEDRFSTVLRTSFTQHAQRERHETV